MLRCTREAGEGQNRSSCRRIPSAHDNPPKRWWVGIPIFCPEKPVPTFPETLRWPNELRVRSEKPERPSG